jgi:hypothetical protein
MHLFAASFKWPATVFTVEVLEHFHINVMECKTSAQGFFTKLRRLTNDAFPHAVPVGTCYSLLLLGLIEYFVGSLSYPNVPFTTIL